MRISAALRWTAVMGLVLGAAGTATADNPGAPPSTVPFEAKQNMSARDMLTKAQGYITRIDTISATIGRQLEQARTARNVVKSLFLNDKKSQVDVAQRMAKERFARMQAILAPLLQGQSAIDFDHSGEGSKAKSALLVFGQTVSATGTASSTADILAEAQSLLQQIGYSAQQAEQILAEAQSVSGGDISFTGATQVTLSIDPNLPGGGDQGTTYNPAPPGGVVVTVTAPPPPMSPTGG